MMKRIYSMTAAVFLLCLMLVSISSSASATPSRGDLLRFVPTIITIKTNSVTVEGYFVNLNKNCHVKNFREFDMTVYKDGEKLVDGDFGKINEFTVRSMGTTYQSFTFNGYHTLNNGTIDCDDHYYCAFSCDFTYQNIN